jgi:hypothetical protein
MSDRVASCRCGHTWAHACSGKQTGLRRPARIEYHTDLQCDECQKYFRHKCPHAPTELVVGQTSLAGPSITFMTNAMRGIQEAAAKSGYCCEECKISSHSNRSNVNLFMIFAADVKRSPLQTERGRGLLIGITNGLMFTSGHMTPDTVDSIKNGLTVLGLNGSTTIPVIALPRCSKASCFAPLFITDAFWFAIIPINNQFILVSCKNHLKRIWIKRGDKQIFMDSPHMVRSCNSSSKTVIPLSLVVPRMVHQCNSALKQHTRHR